MTAPRLRFHLALSCDDLTAAIVDYTQRLGAAPKVVVPGQYALFRTPTVNLSLRQDAMVPPGQLRHLGWEDPNATEFTADHDVLGILWERFDAKTQAREIETTWPGTDCSDVENEPPEVSHRTPESE